jgi:predicted nucleic acid-binding Zn ribbon protein
MKCATHHAEAIAVCAYCGRALCPECSKSPPGQRMVCSSDCGTALSRTEKAIQLILQKSEQSARASAFYCYLCGMLSAGAAVAAYFLLPSPFLILFTAGCAVALLVSGFWYGRVAKQQKLAS